MERYKNLLADEKTKLFIRAAGHNELGMYKEAAEDCEKLIKMDANDPGPYRLLGLNLEKNGEIDEAMQSYQSAIMRFPRHPDFYTHLGYCYEIHKKQPAIAFVYYKKALGLNQKDFWSLNNIGHIYQKNAKWQDALYYYKKAYELSKEKCDGEGMVHTGHNLAWAHYHCGNYDEAFTLYKNLANNHPDDYVAIHSIFADYACVQYKKRLFGDALESLDKALLIHPKNRRCRRLYNVIIKRIK